MNTPKCRACGLLYCYNEESVLRDTLTYYLSEGIDLVVFDNCSTDSSPAIVKEFQETQEKFPGKIIDVVRVQTKGFEWIKILQSSCEYMHKNLNHYDWLLVIDSDSFYVTPVKGMPILEFIAEAQKFGYNVIDGKLYEFYPTEKDDPKIQSVLERMKYGKDKSDEVLFVHLKYHRIFRYHPSIEFYTSFGHIINRNGRRVLNKVRFIYKHYPWVSFEQGVKKIFQDRKPRYVERAVKPILHPQWMGTLPIEKDLIKRSAELSLYDENQMLISRRRFSMLMHFGFFSDILGPVFIWAHFFKPVEIIKALPRFIKTSFEMACQIANSLPNSTPQRLFTNILRELRKDIFSLKKENRATLGPMSDGVAETMKIKIMSYVSAALTYPVAFGFPTSYHFLMTNFCNARCIFCNQSDAPRERQEITLDKFKTMVAHIPPASAKVFYFTGGGEPLLAGDIFSIIRYVNENYPGVDVHIRTNGILIGKYAQELAGLNISKLEISIHGLEEVNNSIMQHGQTAKVFEGIVALDKILKSKGRRMDKVFCCALSRQNIAELPGLLKKAAGLGVSGVDATFLRYYPGFESCMGGKLKKEDSLYFHKELYNQTIKESLKLAKKLKLHLEYEGLFFKPFKTKPCLQPWRVILVDWQGDVYPCTGGECWFEEEVRSKKYCFGNLLNDQAYQFWFSESYVRLRRSNNYRSREPFVPECFNCHNTICLQGPDAERGHLLRKTVDALEIK